MIDTLTNEKTQELLRSGPKAREVVLEFVLFFSFLPPLLSKTPTSQHPTQRLVDTATGKPIGEVAIEEER